MSSKVMSNICSSLGLGRGSDELPNSSAHQAKIASVELELLFALLLSMYTLCAILSVLNDLPIYL
jgi:hypothetical protein